MTRLLESQFKSYKKADEKEGKWNLAKTKGTPDLFPIPKLQSLIF